MLILLLRLTGIYVLCGNTGIMNISIPFVCVRAQPSRGMATLKASKSCLFVINERLNSTN
jgi:hypothetical protein